MNNSATVHQSVEIRRMWINQPSSFHRYHNLHGEHVLAVPERDGMYRIYFLHGDGISQRIHRTALSAGWPNKK